MEEIRVYHSIRKNIVLMAVSWVFVAFGFFLLKKGEEALVTWACILFFGFGGLYFLYLLLREKIADKPYYIITDECITMDSGMKKWEVRFADVEEFILVDVSASKQIGIKYKKEIATKKMNDASSVGRAIRKMNKRMVSVQETLPADNLTIKPQQLCDLLNMRLTTLFPNNPHLLEK